MIYSIQYLRFILAMLVVTLHFFSVYSQTLYIGYFTLAVDVFFVLAGFIQVISTQRDKNPKTYLVKRIKRIIPIYWIMTISGTVALFLFNAMFDRGLIESLFLIPITDVNSNHDLALLIISQGWTLQFDFLLYFIIAIFFAFNKKDDVYKLIAIFLLIVTTISFADITTYVPYVNILFSYLMIFFEYFLGIMIGLLYFRTDFKEYKNNKYGGALIIVGIIMLDVKESKSILLGKLSFPIYIYHIRYQYLVLEHFVKSCYQAYRRL